MSTKHIIFTYILGLITEAALIVAAVYGGLWLTGWIAERLPAWFTTVGFMMVLLIGWVGLRWDSRRAVEYDGAEELWEEGEVANGLTM